MNGRGSLSSRQYAAALSTPGGNGSGRSNTRNSDRLTIFGFNRSMFDTIVEPHRPVETTKKAAPAAAVPASPVTSNDLK
jgi:hypothetical protein